jgi:wyosine [tRNA(Phe)-imidazoG37] synthetase (radical SAM superfamily)
MDGTESPRRLDFQDHRRSLGENVYVYPVVSRRSGGLSVGINLNPDKLCNFDCPYCQVDRTVAPQIRTVDTPRLLQELDALLALAEEGTIWDIPPFDTVAPQHRRLCDIAFSGDGEPTSFAGLGPLIDAVADRRDAHGLGDTPLVLITNASLFHKPRVADALARLHHRGGRIWAKLDAGTNDYFQWVCGTEHKLDAILKNITTVARQWPIAIQAMFLARNGVPASELELDAWARCLGSILAAGGHIELVQVYTVARKPADPALSALGERALEDIAARARQLGLPAEVYP